METAKTIWNCGAIMAYGYIQKQATTLGAGFVTTIDCAYSPSVTAGSLLIACFTYSPGATDQTFTVSDTVGTNDTWSEVPGNLFGSGDNFGMRMFYLPNAASGATTVRCTIVGGGESFQWGTLSIFEYSGIATTTPLVGQASQLQLSPGTGTDAVSSGNTGTLTAQPAMVFGIGLGWDVANSAIGSTYTDRGVVGSSTMRAGDKRVTDTTAVSATFTVGTNDGSNPHFTFCAAFAETGGGGTTPKGPLGNPFSGPFGGAI